MPTRRITATLVLRLITRCKIKWWWASARHIFVCYSFHCVLILTRNSREATMITENKIVTIDYTNWRGERRTRRIQPISITFGSNQWHKEPQWLLLAQDVELNKHRTFAMSGIHAWLVP